ncbi:MAG TPA: DUF481 domain-containing protein [Candidatus Cloacimonetes bacterium]|nr:DUF481 domain-containing protein [Candidatus Cloacimonadota bacterium]
MKRLVIITILTLSFAFLMAEGWDIQSDVSLTLSQSAYSENWVGTELSNITWLANGNFLAQKQLLKWLHNKNTIKAAFGQTHVQDTDSQGEKYWEAPTISTDKIDAETLYRFTLDGWVDPFAAGRLQTRFLDESQKPIDNTRIFNNMLFTESAGIMKNFLDSKNTLLSTRLGVAFRQDVDRDRLDPIADKKETFVTSDGGLEFVSEYNKNIKFPLESTFKSKLNVYKALINSKSDELNNDWKAPVATWENTLNTKLFGAVSANFLFEMRYNKQQVDAIQWQQMLGLGVSYNLF